MKAFKFVRLDHLVLIMQNFEFGACKTLLFMSIRMAILNFFYED